MRALLGPADADHFRIKVGRYKERWYVDPLDGCTIAPADPDWHGPSFSNTKPPFANKYVPMRAIADMPETEWARLATVTPDARYAAIKDHEWQVARRNMDRGSIVHRWAEDRLLGRAPLFDLPGEWVAGAKEQAERFRPALDAFFDTYQPELVAAEVVCIHRDLNGIGYGCTVDALVKIGGEIWDIDYKSRNSDHDAYLEEAAQGGAGIGAQYMIIRGENGDPVRAPIPDVAGHLVVSIREDGFRVYPIDRDGAVAAYHSMHEWWVAQRKVTENKVIGRPWAPRATVPAEPPAAPDKRASIVARIKALIEAGHGETLSRRWPEGIPGFGTTHPHTDAEIAQVHAVVQRLEDDNGFGFHPDDAPEPEPPAPAPEPELPPAATLDDGKRVSVEARDQLNAAYAALDPAQRGDVDRLRSELPQWASPPGCGPYLRHWEILRTAVLWAEAGWDDDIIRDLTAAVTGDDAVRQPAVKIGEAWAALTIAQALELAELARLVLDGTHQVTHHQDRWRLKPAA